MYICIFPVSMLASFMKPSLVFTLTDIGYFSVEFSRILHFNVDGYSFKGNVTDGNLKFSVPVIFFLSFFLKEK